MGELRFLGSCSVATDLVGSTLACCCMAGELDGPPVGGVAHGDDTRGGSGSNVNIDPDMMLLRFRLSGWMLGYCRKYNGVMYQTRPSF
jgi:hypothetical protein